MPARGIHSVTVPGCVDGWEKLHRQFGRLPWKDLFQPAIHIARGGHAIHLRVYTRTRPPPPRVPAGLRARSARALAPDGTHE
jgi:gamma-glutamyltranspeptidase/glutathione hydrolase